MPFDVSPKLALTTSTALALDSLISGNQFLALKEYSSTLNIKYFKTEKNSGPGICR